MHWWWGPSLRFQFNSPDGSLGVWNFGSSPDDSACQGWELLRVRSSPQGLLAGRGLGEPVGQCHTRPIPYVKQNPWEHLEEYKSFSSTPNLLNRNLSAEDTTGHNWCCLRCTAIGLSYTCFVKIFYFIWVSKPDMKDNTLTWLGFNDSMLLVFLFIVKIINTTNQGYITIFC